MKALFCLASLLSLWTTGWAEEEGNEPSNVLVLTDANFNATIEAHQQILVEFYAPWCGHCKQLEPEYEKAATILHESGSSVVLAKVDATVEKETAKAYEIQGFPTLKFFVDGKPKDVRGARSAEKILAWIKKKTGPAATTIHSHDELLSFVKITPTALVGFFPDSVSDAALQFWAAADQFDDAEFGIVHDEALVSLHSPTSGVVLFTDEGEKRYSLPVDDIDGIDSEKIIEFAKNAMVPVGAEFSQELASKIFSGGVKTHLFLFIHRVDENFEAITKPFRRVAKEFKGKMTFVWLDMDKEDNTHVMDFFERDVPDGGTLPASMSIVNLTGNPVKYQPETKDLDAAAFRSFANGVLSGRIERHYKKAPLPADWDKHPVKVLVASNFEEVVKGGKNVLVEFYAPWCGHCKSLAPDYHKLGKDFKDSEDIIIAKMDATENEVKDVEIQGFPTIKYYKADGTVVDFKGKRNHKRLKEFLERGGVNEEEAEGDEEGEEEEEGEGEEGEEGEGEGEGEGEEENEEDPAKDKDEL